MLNICVLETLRENIPTFFALSSWLFSSCASDSSAFRFLRGAADFLAGLAGSSAGFGWEEILVDLRGAWASTGSPSSVTLGAALRGIINEK